MPSVPLAIQTGVGCNPASGFFVPLSRRTLASRTVASSYLRYSGRFFRESGSGRDNPPQRMEVEAGVEGVGHRIGRTLLLDTPRSLSFGHAAVTNVAR
jgi:hypothetical protein